MSECDWPPDWPPPDSPDWRPLLDAIEFLCRRFRSVLKTEAKLCIWLNSSDDPPNFLPSLLVGWDGEREPLTGEIRLALWFSKDNPGEFSGSADDIEIARGEFEKLELPSILILWPRLERLYELTVAQPEPAAQPGSVDPRAPVALQEAAAPREEKPVQAAIPERKPGRIDWGDFWKYCKDLRLLPPEKDFLDEATQLIKDRYRVKTVPESELRRLKAALYRGDSERPKRTGRKQSKRKQSKRKQSKRKQPTRKQPKRKQPKRKG